MKDINIGEYLTKEAEKAIENAYDKDFLFKQEKVYYRKARKIAKKEFMKQMNREPEQEVILDITSNGEIKRKLVI